MVLPMSAHERLLLLACTALLSLAVALPPMAQPAHLHDFADQRLLWGIPCAFDVLSNLPFAIAGVLGLLALRRLPADGVPPPQRAAAALFFAGLLVTAAGSAWYHLSPDDPGLAIDRAAMAVAFAGLLGLLAATRVSDRAGWGLSCALLVLGPASAWTWYASGNVVPWAVVQFGGIALVLLVLAVTRPLPGALHVRWAMVLLAYGAAKLLEVNDLPVFEASGELLSGHTLKHVVAAFAAWPVIAAVAARRQRQNGLPTAARIA